MLFSTFTLSKTLLYYKGGEFKADGPWKHKEMFHKGDYELIFCIKDPLYLQVGNERLTLRQNEILIVPPFTTMVGYKKSANVDFYWVHFFSQQQEKMLNVQAQDLFSKIQNKDSDHTDKQLYLPMQFKLVDYEQTTILIHQILSIHNELSFIEERDYLVSALLIQLYNSYWHHFDLSDDESSRIDYVKEWIRANISNTLTVAEIAEKVHLNPDYLTRLFKHCTGMSTLKYLNHIKIEVATLLLIRTEMSIKEIAYNSYFNDPKVFMRRFKSEMGLSPSEYRKSYNLIHLNNPHVDPQIPIPKRIADSIDYIPENGSIPE
ncbi:AraC family transcriptional regulator [Secundilactobacillus sp. HBUAS58055]|nr:AraC family transcriptional regulator [Secundilactobacillus angelensis]MCH5462857.1 AraC family transcriptional regulator [Secundilactobacillus angelensis]